MEHHLVQQRRLGIQCFNTLQSKHEREDKNCAMDQALLHETIELILWSTYYYVSVCATPAVLLYTQSRCTQVPWVELNLHGFRYTCVNRVYRTCSTARIFKT